MQEKEGWLLTWHFIFVTEFLPYNNAPMTGFLV